MKNVINLAFTAFLFNSACDQGLIEVRPQTEAGEVALNQTRHLVTTAPQDFDVASHLTEAEPGVVVAHAEDGRKLASLNFSDLDGGQIECSPPALPCEELTLWSEGGFINYVGEVEGEWFGGFLDPETRKMSHGGILTEEVSRSLRWLGILSAGTNEWVVEVAYCCKKCDGGTCNDCVYKDHLRACNQQQNNRFVVMNCEGSHTYNENNGGVYCPSAN